MTATGSKKNRVLPAYLRTSDIARAVGVHPNTVRLYEAWGFLPPAARSPAGYRQFTRFHLNQMRLARTALHGQWPGRNIRRSLLALVRHSASGDASGALEMARAHLRLVQTERTYAEQAVEVLNAWIAHADQSAPGTPLSVGQTAQLLEVSVDMLRDWERNGLLAVPRHRHSRYRQYYAPQLARLRVIRLLRQAGYSTMAILRMLNRLDRGAVPDLRHALNTPSDDEEALSAADRWLSTLAEQETRANDLITQLSAMQA